jgi:hypothetical protein
MADLLPELGGSERQAGQDSEPAGPGNLGHQLRPRDPAHPGLEDWDLDAEEIGEGGSQHRASCLPDLTRSAGDGGPQRAEVYGQPILVVGLAPQFIPQLK